VFTIVYQGGSIALQFTPNLTPHESWLQAHFGESWANPALAADSADPDADGVPNLLERAFGGNPQSPENDLLPELDPNAPLLSIRYRKLISAPDLTYTVQESSSLTNGTWTTVGATPTVLETTASTQTLRLTVPIGSGERKFVRVRVAR
jgi:hypothetical protein